MKWVNLSNYIVIFVYPFLTVRPFCGVGVIADAIFTNLWAVEICGCEQESEELAQKYGLSYEKHVSLFYALNLRDGFFRTRYTRKYSLNKRYADVWQMLQSFVIDLFIVGVTGYISVVVAENNSVVKPKC